MKTSNILLIAVFSVVLLALLGSNLALKAEYDKIDKSDPLFGYKKEVVQPFKYVRLEGKAFGLTEINQGSTHEISILPEKRLLDWKVTGDTLVFTYKRDWDLQGPLSKNDLTRAPYIYISAPEVKGIMAQNVPFRIANWKSGEMSVMQEGGALLFSNNSIDNLKTRVSAGGVMEFQSKNTFGNAEVQVRDSSSLRIEKDNFKSLKTSVDSSAQVSIPGGMLRRIQNM
jgi:hypothetical protein